MVRFGSLLFTWLESNKVSKPHHAVYYIVPFLSCNSLKYIDTLAATNSSKAKVARSNRAGQAKISLFNVVSG
jgi:hypothetical protein